MYLFYTPFSDHEKALEISHKAVTSHLAACANILPPMTSLYLWSEEGKEESLCQDQEIAVLFKVAPQSKESFITFIENHHPYTCPAIICMDATANPAFETWVNRHNAIGHSDKNIHR